MPEKLTLAGWREKVGSLPPLIDHLAYDLFCEGRAPANAVAEAVCTLDALARRGRTERGSRVPFRTQHAARDACVEWAALEFLAGASRGFRIDDALALSLDEAADSMRKATVHEPVGKPGGPGLWKHKSWQLPAYIQHIANDLREKRGMTESRAIATAIAVVKRWAAGGGNVKPDTRAAAAKAVAEWEALKAKAHARKSREAKFVGAAARLKHALNPMPNQASFAIRYANRLSVIEGLLSSLHVSRPLSVRTARQLLEASEDVPVEQLAEELRDRRILMFVLMEALGYSSTPLRARTAEKGRGKFHGMHGVEKAVRKRTHVPDSGEEHPVLAARANGGRLTEGASVLAPASSAAFEQLHPRAAHGQFGAKPGEEKPAGANGGGGGGEGAAALADAIRQADPEFRKQYGETMAFAKAHPSGTAATQANMAGQQIQNIGYANDAAGISQFQKDEGLPVTGKLDDVTLRTVGVVYKQNARSAAARVPDFTGIAGAGARISGARKSGAKGRTTLGKTTARKINEAESVLFRPAYQDDDEHASPGQDDFDFDGVPQIPPGLRDGEGVNVCATCVHFSPGGWVTRQGVGGGCMAWTWPVDKTDTCDDWLTLTPPDAPLRVFEARLREAQESGKGEEIVVARAALKIARERYPDSGIGVHPADADLHALLVAEGTLTAAGRKKIKAKNFAIPEDKSYPIHDESHAKNALSRSSGKPEEARVRAAVKKKYPHLVKD